MVSIVIDCSDQLNRFASLFIGEEKTIHISINDGLFFAEKLNHCHRIEFDLFVIR
jgi:hypothetical protein